jgi:hypothetical protein
MSGTLYELTATAAWMYMPIPIPAAAPSGWLDLLDHWQTLIGATFGGLLGVIGAWIVAISTRRREQRVAAGMVLPDLQQLCAASQTVERSQPPYDPAYLALMGISQEGANYERIKYLVGALQVRRPALFALHTPTVGQLSDIDARLYSHVFQCQMIHHIFESGIKMLGESEASSATRRLGPTHMGVYAEWAQCVEHATLACYFLDRFMFTRWPRWAHRCRMKLRPNDLDKRSKHLLTKGEILANADAS